MRGAWLIGEDHLVDSRLSQTFTIAAQMAMLLWLICH